MALSSRAEEYTTGDILNPNTIQGAYQTCSGNKCWGQLSGGQIPTWDPTTGVAVWGYGGGILNWTTAINTALEQAGFQVDGYNYEWRVKNYDAHRNQNDGNDYLRVSVRIFDGSGKELYGKQFNLDGYYNWTSFTGTERFNDSIPAEDINHITIRTEGDDIGFWAGWYGPEFDAKESSISLIYSPLPQDPCNEVPVTDPTCPNYVTPGLEDTLAITIQDNTFGDNTGEVVIETIPEPINDSISEELDTGLGDVVAESTQSSNQEQTQEESGSSGGGLSEAQKNALSAAFAEANAAEQVASASSAASIAIGDAANESAVSTTLQNSAAMNSASQSMSSSSMSGQSNNGSNDGSSSGQSGSSSFDMTNSTTGGLGQTGEPSLELAITVADDVAVSELSDVVQSILKETFKKIQEQSKESSTAGLEQKPSDDPAEDQKLAMMQNPDIAQYQQSFLPDAAGYDDKEIYQGQRVIDNPAGRFFNGASDQLHRKMVREQYDR